MASVLSSSLNRFKQCQRIAEDMKIYNSQLEMSLFCLVEVHLRITSTLQVYVPTIAWYRQIHEWAPSQLASCVTCCKEKEKRP